MKVIVLEHESLLEQALRKLDRMEEDMSELRALVERLHLQGLKKCAD